MKVNFSELAVPTSELTVETIKSILSSNLSSMESEFVQDMSHISPAAGYKGNMTIDNIEHIRDDLFRCEYSYEWEIAWTCSGTQENGRVTEKVRFTVSATGNVEFKFLKFD